MQVCSAVRNLATDTGEKVKPLVFTLKAGEHTYGAAASNQEFQAIYFNAWEDDFSDDPMIAISGQLSDNLRTRFQERVSGIVHLQPAMVARRALGYHPLIREVGSVK